MQIQNRGTLGGNVANASPAGDTLPVLLAVDADRRASQRVGGTRRVPMTAFYTGYRQTRRAARRADRRLRGPRRARAPVVPQGRHARRTGDREDRRRRSLGHANAAASGDRQCGTDAVAAFTDRGGTWRRCVLADAQDLLQREIAPIDDLRSTAEYRRQVAANLLAQFYAETGSQEHVASGVEPDSEVNVSAARRVAVFAVMCVMWSAAARTQWLDYPTPASLGSRTASRISRRRCREPPTARLTVWRLGSGWRSRDGDRWKGSIEVRLNIATDLPGGAPFLPWAKALHDERQKALGVGAPSERCLPHSIPAAMLTRTLPFKILQMRGVTLVLYEEFNNWRQVFTDGRPIAGGPSAGVARVFRRVMGGRCLCRADRGLQRQVVAGCGRHTSYRGAQDDRAPPSHRLRSHGDHVHLRGPEAFTKPWSVTTRSTCWRIPNCSSTTATTRSGSARLA